jgi:hypothetical protein
MTLLPLENTIQMNKPQEQAYVSRKTLAMFKPYAQTPIYCYFLRHDRELFAMFSVIPLVRQEECKFLKLNKK